ncbi:MAG: FHA domain-containing protein [Gammaproteobacteria bacterium]|nr:FHA domain-containing protein [Gammaproteobacteria bacterium]MBU1482343.1 FHA domain-containing protein [Gammaproteobacteria bacterium]
MSAPFYIEVLARNGEVRQRQRVDALPIRIGQGYDNDFILDDRHTSAHHAVIEGNETGGLEVIDLGSRNGVVHKGKRQARLTIDGNTVFRLGHTNLRVRTADFSVADEMRDTTLHYWEGLPPALTGLVLMVLLALLSTWVTNTEKTESIRYATGVVGLLSIGLLWSGGWSLVNRLFGGQTRFGRHLFIAASGLVVMEIASILESLAAYAFSLETLTRYGSHVAVAIAAGMVYFHLVTINPVHKRRRFAFVSVLLFFLGSGMILIVNYQSRGRLADELYMSELFSPGLRMSSDKTVDQFIAESKQLKSIVDGERGKMLGDDGEDDGEGDMEE